MVDGIGGGIPSNFVKGDLYSKASLGAMTLCLQGLGLDGGGILRDVNRIAVCIFFGIAANRRVR
jgi:hypothetical protein